MGRGRPQAHGRARPLLRILQLLLLANEAAGITLIRTSPTTSPASQLPNRVGDGFSPEGNAPAKTNPAFSKWGGTRSEVQTMLTEAEREKAETKKSCHAFEEARLGAIATARARIEALKGRVSRYKWSAKSDAELVELKLGYAKDELFARNTRCRGEARLLKSELDEVSNHEVAVTRLLVSTRCDGEVGRRIHGCDTVTKNMMVLSSGIGEKKQVLEAQQARLDSACHEAVSELEAVIAGLADEMRGRQKQLLARKEADVKTGELHRLFADYVDTTDRCEQALREHAAEIDMLRVALDALDKLAEQVEAGDPS